MRVGILLGGFGVTALAAGWLPGCGNGRSCEETLTCARPAGGAAGSTSGGSGEAGESPSAGRSSSGGTSGRTGGTGGTSGRSAGGAGARSVGGEAGEVSTGGTGAAGEGGGGETPVDCVRDSECEDGLDCNGIGTCVDGSCVAGTPFCASSAEVGCTVTCTEGAGGPSCHKTAEDADGDDHAPIGNGCSVADKPADDCDDGNEDVYPGAPETCDGVDSDCDGLEDIDDGGVLSGVPVRIGVKANATPDSAAAWSDDLDGYGVYSYASNAGNTQERAFFGVSQDGTADAPAPGSTVSTSVSSLVAGHGGFGHLYTEASLDRVAFELVDAVGNIGSPSLVRAGSLAESALAVTPQGWIAGFIDTGAVLAHRLDASGAVQTGVAFDVAPDTDAEGRMSLATDGQNVVFVYDSEAGVRLNRFTQALVAVDDPPIDLAADGDDPAVGVGPRGYGVAWLGAWPDIMFAEVTRAGTVACGPVKVGEDSTPRVGGIAVQPSGTGWLVAHAENGNYRVLLRRVGPACDVIAPELVVDDSTTSYKGNVELYAGSSGFLVAWREPNAVQGFYRLFGANLCD